MNNPNELLLISVEQQISWNVHSLLDDESPVFLLSILTNCYLTWGSEYKYFLK